MPKRGESATPAQRAALKRGQKKRAEALANGPDTTQRERWAKLLDGTITVEDLDDEEIARRRVRGKGGVFSGRSQKLPSHLAMAFDAEAIRRAQNKFRTAAPEAVKALIDIGTNPEVKESDRIRALMYVVDRALGKTPETIRVEGADRWSSILDAANASDHVDRDLADLADGTGSRVVGDEEGAR